MLNPERSGTAQNAVEMLEKGSGEELANRVLEEKVETGKTRIIALHHRQTPLMLMKGEVDAGVTWRTEAVYQEMVGNPFTYVAIPEDRMLPESSRRWSRMSGMWRQDESEFAPLLRRPRSRY